MPMQTFKLPVELSIGACSSEVLCQFSGKRILIICDGFLANTAPLIAIKTQLEAANQVSLFTDVKPDPTVDDVALGIETLKAFKPQIVVAYGGGSAIDLCKAIKYYGHKMGIAVEKSIAIPTTSGTGSEVTSACVIGVPEKQVKMPLFTDELLPDIAILDPKLTSSVPAEVTANTGLDVLTHAIEAIVSTNSSDFSDALAEKAVCMVCKYLPLAYQIGANQKARSKMQNASAMAGIAFNHAGLGLVHAIAHQLGAQFHVPHGLANAVLLVPVIKYNSRNSEVLAKYAKLAIKQGVTNAGDSDIVCVNKLTATIESLLQQVNIASNFKKCCFANASEQVFETMVTNTLADATLATNPVQPSRSDILALIKEVIKGQ